MNVIGYEFHQYKKDNPITAHHSALYANKDDNLVTIKLFFDLIKIFFY